MKMILGSLPDDWHFIQRLAANYQWRKKCYESIFFASKQCISLKNVSTLRLLDHISIATTSTILHLMSRSKTALLHFNIPFLETPYYLNTWNKSPCMCWRLLLHSCRFCPGVMFKCFPLTVKWILFTNWWRCQIWKVLHLQAWKELRE